MGVWIRVRSTPAGIVWHILDIVLKWGADAEIDKAFTKLKAVSASVSNVFRDGGWVAILLLRI
jgi:hypothetical protein